MANISIQLTVQENEWLQATTLDMLRLSSTENSPDQMAMVQAIRSKLEAQTTTTVFTPEEASLLTELIRQLYGVGPVRNPDVQRVLIYSVLGKLNRETWPGGIP